MNRRRTPIEERCQKCFVKKNLCFCDSIHPISIKTRISVIMHVSELKLSSNTVNLARIVIPDTRVYVRGSVNGVFDSLDMIDDTQKFSPLYLFPDNEAIPLTEAIMDRSGPFHLIVPDGNWHQAKKVKRRERGLNFIPTVKLPENLISSYTLRRPPFRGALCTYEAIMYALFAIEGEHLMNTLLPPFELMMQRHQIARSGIEIPVLHKLDEMS